MTTSKILNLYDLIGIGVGSSLSIGVYVLLGELTKNVTGPAVAVCLLLAGVTAAFIGVCTIEFGVLFLKVESSYIYCYSCLNENIAFLVGWTLTFQHITGSASIAKGIILFVDALSGDKISEFLWKILPINFKYLSPYFDFMAVITVFVFTIFLKYENKHLTFIKNMFTVCNVLLLLSLIVAGFFKADIKNWKIDETIESIGGKISDGFMPYGFIGILKGSAIAFYGFLGFDTLYMSENEVKKPHQNLPVAALITLFVITLLYLGAGTALSLMSPYNQLNSFAAFPFAFEQNEWTVVKWIIAGGAFFGFLTSIFGAIFILPKLICSMANDGFIFTFFCNPHSKIKNSSAAIWVSRVLTAIAAGLFTFRQLVSLMVVGALFVYTITAVNVILLRYSHKEEENKNEFMEDKFQRKKTSLKEILQNYFNFKENIPTQITNAIVKTNTVLFCVSSVGLSIALTVFSNALLTIALEAVLPAALFLIIMMSTLLSTISQPKSQKLFLFKIPLVPVTPCLSIFLNILLMTSFDSSTWAIFSVWFILGMLPHLTWCLWKTHKGQECASLYNINKVNLMKLNESIWNIKSKKKSYYENAVNPFFCEDLEKKIKEPEKSEMNSNKILQLKQAEVIQTPDLIANEKTEPLESELEIEILSVEDDNGKEDPKDEAEIKCMADVHIGKEFHENAKFLKNCNVDINNSALHKSECMDATTCLSSPVKENISNFSVLENTEHNSSFGAVTKPLDKSQKINEFEKNSSPGLGAELKEEGMEKQISESGSALVLKNAENYYDQNFNRLLEDIKKVPLNTREDERTNPNVSNADKKMLKGETITKGEDKNKIQGFKEKLNQLLKNQMKSEISSKNNPQTLKYSETKEVEVVYEENEKENKNISESINTLNRSQIKEKLEFILTIGHPKKYSFKKSKNIKPD